MKKVLLLGASGSIGTQTLDILEAHPDEFTLTGAAVGNSEDYLKQLIEKHPSIKMAGMQKIANPSDFDGVVLFCGDDAMAKLAREADYDILVNATVGFRGLEPTLEALKRSKDVALANKESLVAGGDLVREALKDSSGKLYPIDSEHSAIYQCLQGNRKEDVARLIITASGGSLRNCSRDELEDVSIERVLCHPNWSMGKRITTDSATMVNKGFEVIEAHYLFDLDYDQIDTVLHPQSIVHSMVEYKDHAVIAQLGSADMHVPIQYALFGPERPVLQEKAPLDMTRTLSLDFQEMDFDRYPILKTAYEVGRKGGNAGAVFNGADEQAVELFLDGKIQFLDIEKSILHALDTVPYIQQPDLSELKESDARARKAVRNYWGLESEGVF